MSGGSFSLSNYMYFVYEQKEVCVSPYTLLHNAPCIIYLGKDLRSYLIQS